MSHSEISKAEMLQPNCLLAVERVAIINKLIHPQNLRGTVMEEMSLQIESKLHSRTESYPYSHGRLCTPDTVLANSPEEDN